MSLNDRDCTIQVERDCDFNETTETETLPIVGNSKLLHERESRISPPNVIKLTYRMIQCHFLFFWMLWLCFYATLIVFFKDEQILGILQSLNFLTDWKMLAFFFVIYLVIAFKKLSDVTNNVPSTDKITNLVSITIKNQVQQKAIMEYVCTSLAVVFTSLSSMVHERILNLGKQIPLSHSMLIKWSLDSIREAQQSNEVDDSLVNTLINELCSLHTQCDRLIGFKHGAFSWSLTIGLTVTLYTHFVVGTIQTLWIGLFKGHDLSFELVTLAGGILIFTALLTVLRWAEQILKPHCDQHDVFELNQILDERLGVASEVINEGCSLRFEVNVSSS